MGNTEKQCFPDTHMVSGSPDITGSSHHFLDSRTKDSASSPISHDSHVFIPIQPATFICYACMLSRFIRVQLFATPWTVALQAHLSMGFSKQEYWSGLPFPSPGDLPNPGIKHAPLASPALAGRFFSTSANLGSPLCAIVSPGFQSPTLPLGSKPDTAQSRYLACQLRSAVDSALVDGQNQASISVLLCTPW